MKFVGSEYPTSGNIGKFGLFLAIRPSKGTSTLAVGLTILVLQADALQHNYSNKNYNIS
jgi:hypothetical protein